MQKLDKCHNTSILILKIVWSFRFGREVLNTTFCDKLCLWLVTGRWFSRGTPVSSTYKTDRYDNIVQSGVKHHNHNHLIWKKSGGKILTYSPIVSQKGQSSIYMLHPLYLYFRDTWEICQILVEFFTKRKSHYSSVT